MWTSQLRRQNIEDKPVNLADVTRINDEIEDSFMCREPLIWVNTIFFALSCSLLLVIWQKANNLIYMHHGQLLIERHFIPYYERLN